MPGACDSFESFNGTKLVINVHTSVMKSPLSHLAQVIISLWSQKGEEKLYFDTSTKKSTLLWIVWMREKLKKVRHFFKFRVCSFICNILYKSMSRWPFNAFNFKIICEVENIQVIETQRFLNRMTAVLLYKLDLRLTTVAVYTNTQEFTSQQNSQCGKNFFLASVVLNRSLRQHFVVWYYLKSLLWIFHWKLHWSKFGLRHVKAHKGIELNEDYSRMTGRRTRVPYAESLHLKGQDQGPHL